MRRRNDNPPLKLQLPFGLVYLSFQRQPLNPCPLLSARGGDALAARANPADMSSLSRMVTASVGLLGAPPWVPSVTSAGVTAPLRGGHCWRLGQPLWPPVLFWGSPPQAAHVTSQDLLYRSVTTKLSGS